MAGRTRTTWLAGGALAILAIVLVYYSGKSSSRPDDRQTESPRQTTAIPRPGRDRSDAKQGSHAPTQLKPREDLATALRERDADKVIRLLTDMTAEDPPAIAALVLSMADPAIRVDSLRTVAREWAARDSSAAMAWAQSLADEDERKDVSEFVCYRVAEDDPRKAREMAAGAGFGTGSSLASDLVQQWAARDPADAKNWILSQPEGDARETLLMGVAPLLAVENPAEAGRLVSEELEGSRQEEAAMSVLHQWARKDAAAAADWVASFPEGALKSRAEGELRGIRQAEDDGD